MEIAEVVDGATCEQYLNSLPKEELFGHVRYLAIHVIIWDLPTTINDLLSERIDAKLNVGLMPSFATALISSISFDEHRTNYGNFDFQDFLESTYLGSGGGKEPVTYGGFGTLSVLAGLCCSLVVPRASSEYVVGLFRDTSTAIYDDVYWASVRDFLSFAALDSDITNTPVKLNYSAANEWKIAKERLLFLTDEKWIFWISWYERVLVGRDTYPEMLAPILNEITKEEWLDDPALVNARFAGVLAAYQADDAEAGGASEPQLSKTFNMAAIRSQVSTLKEFLEIEYLKLSGHNARSPAQDDALDLLRELKALIEDMLRLFEDSESEGMAVTVVSQNLPALVEKAGELAIVESEPQVSPTIVVMAASIKSLVDAGADPKLATQIAMSEAGMKKIRPGLKRLIPWWGKSEEGS